MLIRRRHLGAVGVVAAGLDHRLEAQVHRTAVGDVQPAPGDGAATEAAAIADVRDVGIAVGHHVPHRHARGVARAIVDHTDGEGHGVTHVVGTAAHRLGQFQVDKGLIGIQKIVVGGNTGTAKGDSDAVVVTAVGILGGQIA